MSRIEWEEEVVHQPEHLSLEGFFESHVERFCEDQEVSLQKLEKLKGLLVFVERKALESLYDFLRHDTSREHGGVLVGKPYFDPTRKRLFTVITATIPALHTEGNPVHLQFTSQSWEYISGLIFEEFPNQVIVGWHHSHPGLGVFMSSTDRATQRAFFNNEWNVAIVVDPVRQDTGWFCGPLCQRLGRDQIVLFEKQAELGGIKGEDEKLVTKPRQLSTRYSMYSLRQLRWLLPSGFLIIMFALFLWLYWKDRTG